MGPPNCLANIAVRKIKSDFKKNLALFKFMYSEKATKYDEISKLFLTLSNLK